MKKIILAGMLICSLVPADAQNQSRPGFSGQGKRMGNQFRQKLIERFDLDGDGQLNEQERAAAEQARMQRQPFGQRGQKPGEFQNNGQNQHLQQQFNEVMEKLKKESPEKYQKILQRFDANSDNNLDEFEMNNIRAERQTKKMILQRFDSDGDGKLNDAERLRLDDEHQQQMDRLAQGDPQLFVNLLEKFDKNADKKLQIEEWGHALRSGALPPPMPHGRPGMPGNMGMHPQGPQGMPGNMGMHPQGSQGMPGNMGMHPQGPQGMPGQRPGTYNQNSAGNQNPPPQPDDGGLLEGVDLGHSNAQNAPENDSDIDVDLDFLDF